MSQSLKPDNYITPYPNLGEVLRSISLVLETKPSGQLGRDMDRWAREGDFDYCHVSKYLDEVFQLPEQIPKSSLVKLYIDDLKSNFIQKYIDVLKTISVSGYSRAQVVPWLSNEICSKVISHRLSDYFEHDMRIIEALVFADNQIVFAFDLLNRKCSKDIDNFQRSLEKEERDKVQRWQRGKQDAPNFSLFGFLERFCKHAACGEDECCLIYEIFYVAKLVRNILNTVEGEELKQEMKMGMCGLFSITNLFDYLNKHLKVPSQIVLSKSRPFLDLHWKLHGYLRKNECKKSESARADYDRDILKLEELAISLEEYNIPWWRVVRLRAVWQIYSGVYDAALQSYKAIADVIFYTGDEAAANMFKEALCLAAVQGDRAFLKNLKNQGIVFGMFGEPLEIQNAIANKKSKSKDGVVEDWEVDNWASQFDNIFPQKYHFPQAKRITRKPVNSGLLIIGPDEIGREPELKYPNRIWNVDGTRWPQLVWFTSMGNYSAVKRLLEHGADVNVLTSSGDSALLCAVQFMNPTVTKVDLPEGIADCDLFNLLKQPEYSQETLNTPTNKKKITVLGCAIETGRVSVVEDLLERGADPSFRHSEATYSPLYSAIHRMAMCSEDGFKTFSEEYLVNRDLLESVRRHCPGMMGMTLIDIQQVLKEKVSNPRHHAIINGVIKYFKNDIVQNYREDEFIKIIELLLKAGAKPNDPHKRNGYDGYTPLMFAAENDMLEVFKRLIAKGGDPRINCSYIHSNGYKEDMNCLKIAHYRESKRVLDYLKYMQR